MAARCGFACSTAPPNRVRIEIADTGHGIPDHLMPRIFEPWVSTKKPGRGTGLGLAIARDVVSAHGGTITVASTVGSGHHLYHRPAVGCGPRLGRAAS